MNERINEKAAKQLREMWGGRWPTWEEFREASADGRVQVNKTIAAKAVFSRSVPYAYRIFYGYVLIWLGFLSLPIAAAIWFFTEISAWWIAAGAVISWLLVKVSREGHCQGIEEAATEDEKFYRTLLENGAFLFEPKK